MSIFHVDSAGYMKNFQHEGKKGESAWKGKKRETKGAFGSRDGARPDLHSATCAKCGKECQVPFRPNGKRPVYCSICFDKTSGAPEFGDKPSYSDRGERGDRREAPRAGVDVRALEQQLKAINAKLDALIDALAGDDEDFEGEEDEEDEEEGEE